LVKLGGRVQLTRAFVMLEPYTVKVVRTVLRGKRAVRP
jgi:hypothetical protein